MVNYMLSILCELIFLMVLCLATFGLQTIYSFKAFDTTKSDEWNYYFFGFCPIVIYFMYRIWFNISSKLIDIAMKGRVASVAYISLLCIGLALPFQYVSEISDLSQNLITTARVAVPPTLENRLFIILNSHLLFGTKVFILFTIFFVVLFLCECFIATSIFILVILPFRLIRRTVT